MSKENYKIDCIDTLGNLTYLKKWVRTRHAILFRLSNRTVQVIFFDHSEILLSSEARTGIVLVFVFVFVFILSLSLSLCLSLCLCLSSSLRLSSDVCR